MKLTIDIGIFFFNNLWGAASSLRQRPEGPEQRRGLDEPGGQASLQRVQWGCQLLVLKHRGEELAEDLRRQNAVINWCRKATEMTRSNRSVRSLHVLCLKSMTTRISWSQFTVWQCWVNQQVGSKRNISYFSIIFILFYLFFYFNVPVGAPYPFNVLFW